MVGRGARALFPRTVSTKINVLGGESESKKEATNWLVERVSYLVTQGKPTQTVGINHSLKLLHPNYLSLPRMFKMETKLRTKGLYTAVNINV